LFSHTSIHIEFEIRAANDMTELRAIQLPFNTGCQLLYMPIFQQFLITSSMFKNLYFIDLNGQLKEITPYDNEIEATALINDRCLVIQTTSPPELRFYDL
jgi:hypothetical protein